MSLRSILVGVVLAGICFVAVTADAFASVEYTEKLTAVRAVHPLSLDATLGDPAWQSGTVATDFYNFTTKRPPSVVTMAYVLYDDDNLYVAFHCEQASFPIIATQTTNNVGLGLDDYVFVGIDPSANGSRNYQFFTTPRGVQYQVSSESTRYQPAWRTAAKIDGTSWNVVMVIPLKDVRGSPGAWRINLGRHISSVGEDLTWAYDRQMDAVGDSTYWPLWTGLAFKQAAARPKARADIFGLANAGANRSTFPQLNGTAGPSHARNVGIDATLPFTNTLALVGTINPDFSNVESDQQIITPQQFQRALTEYRPFFAQGANYLTPNAAFGINGPSNEPFYTPSIGVFNTGGKVEGTVGLNAIGALGVNGPGFTDAAFGFNHRSADQASRYWLNGVVAHHSQDGSSVIPCPFVGNVELHSCTDSVFEFGTRVSSLKTGVEEAFDYSTQSGDYVPDGSKGHSFLLLEAVNRTYYNAGAAYRDIGPYYAPVDGLTLINDMRGPAVYGNFNGLGAPGKAIKNYSGGFAGERYVDQSGAAKYSEYSWFVQVRFKNLLSINTGPLDSQLRQYDVGFPVYLNGTDFSAHTNFIGAFYRDGTPQSIDAGWTYGPNAAFLAPGGIVQPTLSSHYFNEIFVNGSDQLTARWNVSAGYTGDRERCYFTGCDIQQSLRRVAVGYSFGPESNLSLALRTISGTGFSPAATNFAASFHRRFASGSELYVEWGTPQTLTQLDRFIFKYILHLGGGAGT